MALSPVLLVKNGVFTVTFQEEIACITINVAQMIKLCVHDLKVAQMIKRCVEEGGVWI
jgi:hypothetical protein